MSIQQSLTLVSRTCATWPPFKFSGKESLARVGLDLYDFGARMYSPSNMRWLTMDPLCEKYYSISPYAYCAGVPVNLVDPDGMQWYSYTDENGDTQYKYREGEMPDEEKDKDLKDLGYFFFDYKNHVYHSLFGKEVNWGEIDNDWAIVELCNKVDRLIIDYAKDAYDTWSGSDRVNMHIDGWPLGKYTFVYNGLTFTTKKGCF